MDKNNPDKKSKLPYVLVAAILLIGASIYGYVKYKTIDAESTPSDLNAMAKRIDKVKNTETRTDSQAYLNSNLAHEKQKAEQAGQTGASTIPRFLSMEETRQPATPPPAQRTEKPEQKQTGKHAPPAVQPRVKRDPNQDPYLNSDLALIRGAVEQNNNLKPSKVVLTSVESLQQSLPKKEGRGQIDRDPQGVMNKAPIPAGTMLYAILDIGANSDQPNTPVLARIIGGEWSGATATGGFRRENEKLILQFNKFSYGGREYTITGYAIDTKDYTAGIATDVDTHFLERWGSLVAASMLEGIGRAKERSGTTYVYGGNNGNDTTNVPEYDLNDELWIAGGVVGQRAARQVEKTFDRAPTVSVAPGTQIGILIL